MNETTRRAAVAAAITVAGVTGAAILGLSTTYTGPDGGDWSDGANWDNGVPDGFTTAIVNGNAGVGVDVVTSTTSTAGGLTVGSDDRVIIANGDQLWIDGVNGSGIVDNAGEIVVDTTTGNTYFRPAGGDITLMGGGTLTMNDGASWLYNTDNVSDLVNVDNTIQGAGHIGFNNTGIVNQGTIDANSPTDWLEIDPNVEGLDNQGTLRASNGGELRLLTGTYTNTTGIIEALDGSKVSFRSNTIIGGTLQSSGSGELVVEAGVTVFDATGTAVSFLDPVRIDNGDSIWIGGSLVNENTITLDTTTGNTFFRPSGGDLTLTGGGTIQMNDGPSWLYNTDNVSALINVDHTIQGAGHIGFNATPITNQSLIMANSPTDWMEIDPNASGLDNEGTLRASNGGELRLLTGTYDNVNGVIEALDGSKISFRNVTITGGTVQSSGSGDLRVEAGTTTFDGLGGGFDLLGPLTIDNADALLVRGVLNNPSTITLDTSTGNTYFRPAAGDLTLTGGGTIQMNDGPSWIYNTDSVSALINVDNTIQGAGHLGFNNTTIVNGHLIIANSPTDWLEIDPSAAGIDNNGTLRASNGAELRLLTGNYDNADGVIEALDGSFVSLRNVTIDGGTLATAGSGFFTVEAGSTTLDSSVNPISLQGPVMLDNGDSILARGVLDNQGTITIGTTNGNTYFRPAGGDLTLTGGGTIHMNDGPTWMYSTDAASALINVDNTIQGAGHIGFNNTPVTNEAGGTISANSDGDWLEIDPNVDGFLNHGALEATGDGGLRIQTGPFTTDGTVLVTGNSELIRTGDYVQTGGSSTIEGLLEIIGVGQVDVQGGLFEGNGVVDGSLENSAFVGPGSSAGELTVLDDYEQTGDGTLIVEIAGTGRGQFDVLTVGGEATLSGTLDIDSIDGYVPMTGDAFTILTATVVNGTFQFGDCEGSYRIDYNPDSVVLTVVGELPFGDLNCDGNVDVTDLLIVLASWGPCDGCVADLDNNGEVGVDELLVVLGAWTG